MSLVTTARFIRSQSLAQGQHQRGLAAPHRPPTPTVKAFVVVALAAAASAGQTARGGSGAHGCAVGMRCGTRRCGNGSYWKIVRSKPIMGALPRSSSGAVWRLARPSLPQRRRTSSAAGRAGPASPDRPSPKNPNGRRRHHRRAPEIERAAGRREGRVPTGTPAPRTTGARCRRRPAPALARGSR